MLNVESPNDHDIKLKLFVDPHCERSFIFHIIKKRVADIRMRKQKEFNKMIKLIAFFMVLQRKLHFHRGEYR